MSMMHENPFLAAVVDLKTRSGALLPGNETAMPTASSTSVATQILADRIPTNPKAWRICESDVKCEKLSAKNEIAAIIERRRRLHKNGFILLVV
jgi:hypothetical protein